MSDPFMLQNGSALLRSHLLQSDVKQNDSDSEYISPIPTIILDQESQIKNDGKAVSVVSINENDSKFEGFGPNDTLALPRSDRQQSNSVSDADEESSNEYEQPNDHSKLCLLCCQRENMSKDSVFTQRHFRCSIDKKRRCDIHLQWSL